MGFILTLVYVAIALFSPADLFPALGENRVELVIILLALVFSIPALLDARFFRIPQIYLLLGLTAAVFFSVVFAENWLGGGLLALQRFLPSAMVFYLIVLNCQSVRKLNVLVWLLMGIATLYVAWGAKAYFTTDVSACQATYNEDIQRRGSPGVDAPKSAEGIFAECSPLLKLFPAGDGNLIFRVRGLGFLRDPNDFAQFLVLLLPLVWMRWEQGQSVRNTLLVIAPTILFVWGIYLTHSRGAVIALLVVLMLALKRRVNLGYTVVGGLLGLAFVLMLGFSGGREISLQSGNDRLALWSEGLEMFKHAPLFGVGFQGFADQAGGHTAHNSFVLCLAELGSVGYAFWIALAVFTLSGLNSLISSFQPQESAPDVKMSEEQDDTEEIVLEKWARALRDSLVGFFVAAFFLSRAFAFTFFVPLGIAVALLFFTGTEEEPIARKPTWRLAFQSASLGLAAIAFVYLCLRFRVLFGSGG